ncbi:endo alpha-1,4 polygalactosaminidase [Actinorugispora endophytica]|uniref:Glycosyl hydrolase family 114 n=1 Tax=Actinorugispora endophytica TaxID=1605990 RepID=A0A4R6UJY6_9ACTN|nr:endo alpha-1,4 polygalactosaminidase [Actinorugispora endophytica]TDQ46862.1 glycosyl hydrolase family 114 [Actinorugispora endophytica]
MRDEIRTIRRRSVTTATAVFGAVLALGACAPGGQESAELSGAGSEDPALPPVGARFDYQLGGDYDPPEGVTVVVRDSTGEPVEGLYSICYVNGFQTQPGEGDLWLEEDLVLRDDDGDVVSDPEWPDEMYLDTSTEEKRERVGEIIGEVITGCADAGFDAVELDNLDSFDRTDGLLSEDDNMATAALYAGTAHAEGLAIAQKNASEVVDRGRDEVGFDFAVSEECAQYDECGEYTDAYDGRVLNIEYTDNLKDPFPDVCEDPDTPASTILRDRDLVDSGHPDHVYEYC